ncbi:MAG: hypothetical protein ABL930_11910 [Pseudobdellovibrio sp.]
MQKVINAEISFFSVIIIFMLLFLSSCASKSKEPICASVEQEAVSTCRAKLNCRNDNSSYSLGVGFGLGNIGLGANQITQNQNYADCIDKDLAAQKRKAEKK